MKRNKGTNYKDISFIKNKHLSTKNNNHSKIKYKKLFVKQSNLIDKNNMNNKKKLINYSIIIYLIIIH